MSMCIRQKILTLEILCFKGKQFLTFDINHNRDLSVYIMQPWSCMECYMAGQYQNFSFGDEIVLFLPTFFRQLQGNSRSITYATNKMFDCRPRVFGTSSLPSSPSSLVKCVLRPKQSDRAEACVSPHTWRPSIRSLQRWALAKNAVWITLKLLN